MVLRFAGGHPEGGPGTSAGSQVRAGDVAGRPTTAVSSAGWTTSGRLRSARPRWSRENHSEQRSGAVRPHGPTSAVPGSARGPSGGHPGVGTRTRHQVRRTCLPATVCASALSPCHSSPLPADHCKWSGTAPCWPPPGEGGARQPPRTPKQQADTQRGALRRRFRDSRCPGSTGAHPGVRRPGSQPPPPRPLAGLARNLLRPVFPSVKRGGPSGTTWAAAWSGREAPAPPWAPPSTRPVARPGGCTLKADDTSKSPRPNIKGLFTSVIKSTKRKTGRPPALLRPCQRSSGRALAALSLRTRRSWRRAPSRARHCSCDIAGREETSQGRSCAPHACMLGCRPPGP